MDDIDDVDGIEAAPGPTFVSWRRSAAHSANLRQLLQEPVARAHAMLLRRAVGVKVDS